MLSHLWRTVVTVSCQILRVNCHTVKKHCKSALNLTQPALLSSAKYIRTCTQYRTNSSKVYHCGKSLSTSVSEGTVDQQDRGEDSSHLDAIQRIYEAVEIESKKNGIRILPKEECKRILELLLQYKIPENYLKTTFTTVPVLFTYSHSAWEETVKKMLKNYFFNPIQLLPLITGTPNILEGSVWQPLTNVFTLLRGWGFGEGKMQAIVSKHPLLLQKNSQSIMYNYTKLCEVFTKNNVHSIILSNPNVLTDDWDTTHAKATYVCERMGIKVPHILKSNLFQHSLDHIIMRHEFLEKAGLYTKPDKHGVSKTDNATLHNIIDTSNKAFAKLTGLMEKEYATFVSLKRQEFDEADENDDDSDLENFSE